MTATRCASAPTRSASRSKTSDAPTTTSYGDAPRTGSVVRSPMGAILHQRAYLLGDLRGFAPVGVDHVGRDRLVDRGALVEQLLDPSAHVAQKQRSRDAEADPL